ncbi:MAG: Fic family protein [Candidatus Enteromonas sp.]
MEKYEPPFVLNNEMMNLVSGIMEKVGKINVFNELDKLPVLRKQNRIRSIHSSCAIEANSLSLEQVNDVINGKAVVGPRKDIIEVKNAVKAYDDIERIDPYSKEDLLRIHGVIGDKVIPNAGEFRTGNEGVQDENGNVVFIAPPPQFVDGLMTDLMSWMNDNKERIHPLILSSVFHYEFVFIHPFRDGNGRTVRLWQSALLGKWNKAFYYLPIENHIKDHQKEYYDAIAQSHVDGNSNPFVVFMLKMIDSSLEELMQNASIYASNSIYAKKLLSLMPIETWLTAKEILGLLKIKSKETLRKNYLSPLIGQGHIVLELPDKPTSRNQRYKRVK